MSALYRGENRRKYVAELEDGHRPCKLRFGLGELGIYCPLRVVAVEAGVSFFERLSKEADRISRLVKLRGI